MNRHLGSLPMVGGNTAELIESLSFQFRIEGLAWRKVT